MFDVESSVNPIGFYIAQCCVAPMVVGLCSFPFVQMPAPGLRDLLGAGAATVIDRTSVLILLVLGIGIGGLAGKYWPSTIPTGQWIWVVAVSIFCASFGMSVFTSPSPSEVLSIYFESIGSHEGLTRWLITDPAFASAGYSAGMLLRRRAIERASLLQSQVQKLS